MGGGGWGMRTCLVCEGSGCWLCQPAREREGASGTDPKGSLPFSVPHNACHSHRWEAPLKCGTSPSCFLLRLSNPAPPGKVGRQWSSVGSPPVRSRPEPSPGREAQKIGEAENPWLNTQLEAVRFNHHRGLDFLLCSGILGFTGPMWFSGL